MLYGLMGALVSVKKTVYGVGEYPTYLISGQPDAEILWSTYINGKEQEYEMAYGDFIESDGSVEIRWPDPFYTFQIGTWKREAILLNPDGTKDKVSVTFTVQQAPVGTPDTATPTPTPPVQTPPTIPPPPPPVTAPAPITAPPRGGTVYPTQPQPLPPRGTVVTPPIIPPPPPDILNPAPTPVPTQPVPIPAPTNGQVPPRSIYPVGQEPRPPIDRGGEVVRPVVTAPPDILNPAPLPNLPSPLPAPIPPILTAPGGPAAGVPISQPAPQAPGLAEALGGSVNIGGYQIPIVVLGGAFLLIFMGGRR